MGAVVLKMAEKIRLDVTVSWLIDKNLWEQWQLFRIGYLHAMLLLECLTLVLC